MGDASPCALSQPLSKPFVEAFAGTDHQHNDQRVVRYHRIDDPVVGGVIAEVVRTKTLKRTGERIPLRRSIGCAGSGQFEAVRQVQVGVV